jgi:hypothetical protein
VQAETHPRAVQSVPGIAYPDTIISERTYARRDSIMKTAQKILVVSALVSSLSLGAISAFAKSDLKRVDQQKVATYQITRKVNEYEGQHRKVNEYEGQHRKVNEYEGQHR